MNNSFHTLLNQKTRNAFLITSLAGIFSLQIVYTTSAQDLAPNANNENLTQYENSYLGIKLFYPPYTLPHYPYTVEPFGAEKGCLQDRGGCHGVVSLKVGSLNIDVDSVDNSYFSETCNCDTLEEYRNYYYKLMQGVFKGLAQMDGVGIGNYTWVNDNQTTIGKNYQAQQYEYLTAGKIEGKVSACDHTINKHYGILTKVDKIFYRIEHDSCAKPEVYEKFFPEVKKIFDSIEFSPVQDIRSIVTSDHTDNSVLDQRSGSNSLQILSSNSFTDILGFLHVVGEVKNNSFDNVEFVKVVATFYNSNNEVVGTKTTYTNPSDLPVGNTAPFELILTSASIPISEIDNYKLAVNYQ